MNGGVPCDLCRARRAVVIVALADGIQHRCRQCDHDQRRDQRAQRREENRR